jgi:hypothetical protein
VSYPDKKKVIDSAGEIEIIQISREREGNKRRTI